eukprot:15439431-Alexandrium_andersonii.AAC.1
MPPHRCHSTRGWQALRAMMRSGHPHQQRTCSENCMRTKLARLGLRSGSGSRSNSRRRRAPPCVHPR